MPEDALQALLRHESSGTWSGYAWIDLWLEFPVPGAVTNLHVDLPVQVGAVSGTSGSCEINLHYVHLYIEAYVPEPTSLRSLGVGGLSLLRRRR